MATSDLGLRVIQLNESYDDIVIVKALADLPGGRTLDVSNLPETATVIKAGNIIIEKPGSAPQALPVGDDGTYAALPAGFKPVGVLRATILKRDPRAAIITMGQINDAAAPARVTDALAQALPGIQFLYRQ